MEGQPADLTAYLEELQVRRKDSYPSKPALYPRVLPEASNNEELLRTKDALANATSELRAIGATRLFRLRDRLNRLVGRAKQQPPHPVPLHDAAVPSDTPAGLEAAILRKRIQILESKVGFEFVLTDEGSDTCSLATSLKEQWFQNFAVRQSLSSERIAPDGIRLRSTTNRHATVFFEPSARLSPLALYYFADALERAPHARFVYADSLDPLHPETGYKPDFDPLLARVWNYRGRIWVAPDREQIEFTDWPPAEVVHIPFPVEFGPTPIKTSSFATSFSKAPSISVIIPTKDQDKLLRACVESIQKFESSSVQIVVVDNGSSKPELLRYLQELSSRQEVEVVYAPMAFNFSRLNNIGAFYAKGEVLALVNDDIQFVEEEVLGRLAALAAEPNHGAVGPMLLYPSGMIQHGGMGLGYNGFSFGELLYRNISPDRAALDPKIGLNRRISAVLGACLVVEKVKYEAVGGLAEDLAVTCNDVDLCLKLRSFGYENVYAGTCRAIHHAHQTRGLMDNEEKLLSYWREAATMINRFGIDYGDPYYNPNLGFNADIGKPVKPRVQKPWLD
ncbi:MAG TPA: glycosyltransferase [Fimbriimonadaceae bacterium]|jgi:GT2 family glycosyltransferase